MKIDATSEKIAQGITVAAIQRTNSAERSDQKNFCIDNKSSGQSAVAGIVFPDEAARLPLLVNERVRERAQVGMNLRARHLLHDQRHVGVAQSRRLAGAHEMRRAARRGSG